MIAHRKAFLADATTIYAYDLMTGNRSVVFDLRKTVTIPGIDGRLPVRTPLRYTLSIAEDHLYARLGTQNLHSSQNEAAEELQNYSCVVCLGPLRAGNEKAIPLRWTMEPPSNLKDSSPIFEGTPVVEGNRIYALLSRTVGGDSISTVVCYQNPDRHEKPEVLWQKDVGKSALIPSSESLTTQQLLTLADSQILYCNNLGSILALDAGSGRFKWAYQYRSLERNRSPSTMELCPCLVAAGRVFAAPTDSNSIFCLDIQSGRALWEHEGVEGTQFLGVVRDLLICSVRGPVKGLRAIDTTGNVAWSHHDDGGESTFGTGFVTPEVVLWPTKHGLHFLRPSNGTAIRQPISGPFGNLCYADGFLVVTTPTEIWGYVAERHFLNSRKGAVDADPADSHAQMQLALAEADAGLFAEAMKRFQRVGKNPSLANEATCRWRELVTDQLHQAILAR